MFKSHINHLKLRNKLILIYTACVFIPIVLTHIIFYNVTTHNIKEQKTVDANRALMLLHKELGAAIDDAAGISYLYSIDKSLDHHLNADYASYDQYVESLASIEQLFNRSDKEYKTISSTVILSDNPMVLASDHIVDLDDDARHTDWYRSLQPISHTYPYLYVDKDGIHILQKLSDERYHPYEHILKIDLNMDHIHQLFDLSSFEGTLYFIDPMRQIRYIVALDGSQSLAPAPLDGMIRPDRFIDMQLHYQNSRYLRGWSLYGVLDEGQILSEVRQSGFYIIWLALLTFLVPTIIIIMISRSIHSRLKNILIHMRRVKGKHFEPVPYDQERDEIGQLALEFNRMIERIESLINDVYVTVIQKKELEIRQRQAQLHALLSQINPHFLFNALETIRMRSLIKGETETAGTIRNMARIFRTSISWKRSFVSIREEIELIESFLEIQKYRFAGRLTYQISMDEALYETLIPKMTFLPFVENASIHGIENHQGIGFITIQIAREGRDIVFVIADNGAGMSEEKVKELQQYLTEDDAISESVGIKNVYIRLKICFGDDFTFVIHSQPGQGTRITLRLPADAMKAPEPERPKLYEE